MAYIICNLIERHGKVCESIVVGRIVWHFFCFPQWLALSFHCDSGHAFIPPSFYKSNLRLVRIVYRALNMVSVGSATKHRTFLELNYQMLVRFNIGNRHLTNVLEVLSAGEQVAHKRTWLHNVIFIACVQFHNLGTLSNEL